MVNVFNKIFSSIICVDPCPVSAKSTIKASMTILGVVLVLGGLPSKVLGGVAGYAVGSKVANKVFKQL